ncbi:2Fe-2S ferredoxin [Leptolyngbya sp. 'hensonii']|uniref:aromatic ring-hydroxylating oxygenase subunit alpha n=1 Tax=Leptolyngbya sp. 'hensonii' TaxID=1922337 RepID=UPI00094F9ABE|nr:aromatic ring-hydroxylating dioxygenase subunit alpha [Leptolyngbya sp. 'hensonii']OLP17013.1 2Fe-2S ferredoxin [Leptolyngbya sp. 'hensonii']
MENRFFLRNVWYYAMPGQHLKPGAMISKMFLGEPVLLARCNTGQIFALRDICPHRGIPLSCGRFDGQEVACCYHGWRFDASGHCTCIPSLVTGQELDVSRFTVRQYPVQEVQGNIWIYMAEHDRPDHAPAIEVPTIPHLGDQTPRMLETSHFPCHIDHAVIGLMDPAHATFVHQVWWWRSKGALFEKAKQFDPAPYGFQMRRHRLLKTSFLYRLLGNAPEVEIIFRLPGIRIETVMGDRHAVTNLTTVTPMSEAETEVTSMFYWTNPWFSLIQPLVRPLVRAFLEQDRSVVAKQQLGLRHNPALMLIKDADTQARWYFQVKTEYARAIAEQREFINPVKEQVLRWRS